MDHHQEIGEIHVAQDHGPRVRAERVAVESQARVSVQFVLNVLCVFVHLPDQID